METTRDMYAFPEVFVEDRGSNKYIILLNDEYQLTSNPEKVSKSEKRYGHILYENIVDEAVDLVEPRITRGFIVIPHYTGEDSMKAYIVEKNVKPCLIEVKGVYPHILVEEMDEIDEKDKIAYVITGKNEVRVIRSPCRGVVVLVINFPWEKPERYLLVVVGRDELREITVRKDP